MPKRRRRTHVPTAAWDRERGAIGRRLFGRSPQFYATAGVVAIVAVAVGLVVVGFGSNWIEDRNRPGSTAVQVGDVKYSVKYFTERLRQYIEDQGGAGTNISQNPQLGLEPVSQALIEQALLLQFAEEQGQTATDDEIKAEIATMLALSGPNDPNFDARLQEELARTNVSEEQFRDTARSVVLKRKIQAKFASEVPATAEAVHYRQIILADQTEADAVRQQIEGGADFAQIAGEKSLDTTAKENGGDAGWVPRGLLENSLEETLFALEPGGVTTFPTAQNAFVYQLIEKQADRPLDEADKEPISQNNLQDWLEEKRSSVNLVNHMQLPGGDLDKIQYALSRVQQST
jgi:foldase protein PrsA